MPYGKYFFIRSQLNGLVLDVEGGGSHPGARVITWQQKPIGDATNQLWRVDVLSGTIRSKVNDYCLHVAGESLVIQPYQPGNPDQQWVVSGNRIQNGYNPNRVFDIAAGNRAPGARVCAWDYNGGAHQHWNAEHIAPNYFFIRSHMNNKVLDVEGSNRSAGTRAIMYTKQGRKDNQLWYEDMGGVIRSKLNDFALDASSGDIRLQPYNPGNYRQQWVVSGDKIVNRYNQSEALDITACNSADCAPLCAYQLHGGNNQQWSFDYI